MLIVGPLVKVILFTGVLLLGAPLAAQPLPGWKTDWEKATIDLQELKAGGPPKDGIPAIDRPRFVSLEAAAAWLAPQEPVIALALSGKARAYPLQIMTWHEIVNDRLGGTYVTVTFCPLCYSAIAFDRTLGGKVYDFGVSGMLRHSDMVMFDRQTETLWQQLSGEGIVGTLAGERLRALPAQIISFAQFAEAYPAGEVLSRETGHRRNYGQNPYVGYDDIDQRPYRRFFTQPFDDRLRPMEKVITVTLGGIDKAYPHRVTRQAGVVHDTIGGQPVVVFHASGAVSALDAAEIKASREVGSTGVFDPRLDGTTYRFVLHEGAFTDEETGSRWDITGRAVSGPMAGQQLMPYPHGDFFSFAWFAFKPETLVYRP